MNVIPVKLIASCDQDDEPVRRAVVAAGALAKDGEEERPEDHQSVGRANGRATSFVPR